MVGDGNIYGHTVVFTMYMHLQNLNSNEDEPTLKGG